MAPMKPKEPGVPPTSAELAEQVAVGAVKTFEHEVGPVADELRREARESAGALVAFGVVALSSLFALQLITVSMVDALGARTTRPRAGLLIAGLLLTGSAIAATYGRRNRPMHTGRRLLERLAAAMQSPVRE